MPNIQVFGEPPVEQAATLKAKIIAAMTSLGKEKDAVITFINCTVITCDGKDKSMPYLRICSTGGMEELESIREALKAQDIKMDCELLVLTAFTEAKDMRLPTS